MASITFGAWCQSIYKIGYRKKIKKALESDKSISILKAMELIIKTDRMFARGEHNYVNVKPKMLKLPNGTECTIENIFDGKGQKDRVVPIGDRARAWVSKYLEEIRPDLVKDDDSGHVFLTQYGEPLIRNRMSDLIKKYKQAVGIEKRGLCHLFRHAMATHMHENGADIRYIQMILVHENLSSTEIYAQVSIVKLKEVHAATHPAKLN